MRLAHSGSVSVVESTTGRTAVERRRGRRKKRLAMLCRHSNQHFLYTYRYAGRRVVYLAV